MTKKSFKNFATRDPPASNQIDAAVSQNTMSYSGNHTLSKKEKGPIRRLPLRDKETAETDTVDDVIMGSCRGKRYRLIIVRELFFLAHLQGSQTSTSNRRSYMYMKPSLRVKNYYYFLVNPTFTHTICRQS